MGFRAMFGWSQVELHPIIGDFPSGFTHRAVFCALFVQYRIRIVDVNEDALGFSKTEGQLQHATFARERKMAHIACGFEAPLGLIQLIVFSEREVEQSQVALSHGMLGAFSKDW